MTYIDLIPFQYIGKGEQCVIKTKLALTAKKNAEATAILLEEPENHLSHARLNELIADLTDQHSEKQIIISTHSSFVANKLGLDHLIVLRDGNVVRISELEASDFFKKLAGYDTLRLALAKKAILVEGDSDELVVQRAYMDANGGRLPIQDGDRRHLGRHGLPALPGAGPGAEDPLWPWSPTTTVIPPPSTRNTPSSRAIPRSRSVSLIPPWTPDC